MKEVKHLSISTLGPYFFKDHSLAWNGNIPHASHTHITYHHPLYDKQCLDIVLWLKALGPITEKGDLEIQLR